MSSSSRVRKNVRGACQRCRRQKLKVSRFLIFTTFGSRQVSHLPKCDVQRPCTLCRRAGAVCAVSSGGILETEENSHSPFARTSVKQGTSKSPQELSRTSVQPSRATLYPAEQNVSGDSGIAIPVSPVIHDPLSSATMAFVETVSSQADPKYSHSLMNDRHSIITAPVATHIVRRGPFHFTSTEMN